MDAGDLQRRIDEIKFWYHRIELPGGVTTNGGNPMVASAYGVPADLTGKRVLDVGAWDGYWTFEALRRGAREVVAIDDFSDYLGHLEPGDRHAWRSFDICREAFGYFEDRCKRIEMSVYDVTEDNPGGRFDVVFLFGTLYHLRHPLLGLDKLSAICDGEIFVESQICDDYSPYQGGLGQGYPTKHVVAEFFPANELGENATNWWAPSLLCLKALVSAAGFSDGVDAWKLIEKPDRLWHCRGFATGRKPSVR